MQPKRFPNHADRAFRVTIEHARVANGFNEPLFLNRGAIATPKSRLAMANHRYRYSIFRPAMEAALRARSAFCIRAFVFAVCTHRGACSCVPGTDCGSGPRTLFRQSRTKTNPRAPLVQLPMIAGVGLSIGSSTCLRLARPIPDQLRALKARLKDRAVLNQ